MRASTLKRALRNCLLAAIFTIPALAQAFDKTYTVTAPDGVTLAVQESGDPDGQPVVFIHGLLGSRIDWQPQFDSPLLRRYRLISYDLRGHGLSGKPTQAEAYRDGRRWAADLDAVLQAAHARKPVLVGWSLGGAVISNYLAAYGDAAIAGVVYVDGVIELNADQIVAHPDVYRDMTAPDLATHLDGERSFLALCFARQPARATFERLLANAAMASWEMQAAVQSMSVAVAEGLGRTHVPVLLLYGERDALVKARPAIARAIRLAPRAQSKVYADSGHAPFLEEPARFNRDLAEFVEAARPH